MTDFQSPQPAQVPSDEHLMNFLAPWVIADDPKDRADFLAALRAALASQTPPAGRMPAGSARALIARLTAAVLGDDGDEIEAAMTAVSDALQRPWEARFAPAAIRQLMDTFNGEGWRKESDDTDALLKYLGLEPETCRTYGGWLNLPLIKSLLGRCCEKASGPGRVCADCAAASSAYSADMARRQA